MSEVVKKPINETLFKQISEGKVVLFLGAGASVTDEKIYLSKHLIEYYRDIKNISYKPENNDIVDFVNKVFSLDEYDRNDFDSQIATWLSNNLRVAEHHNRLIKFPWLSILSTNVDLILENAIEKNELENEFEFLRSLKEFTHSANLGDKCKIIKLHGCISDLSKYPLIFSSSDFESINKYYKRIFHALSSLGPEVKVLFIGYSFNDRFGNLFLNKFSDSLKGKECYLVDPFANDDEFNIKYLETKNISLIKQGTKEFIDSYYNWSKANKILNSKKRNVFKNSKGVNLSSYFQAKIEPFLVQINNTYDVKDIPAKDFYLGEEPNYSVVKRNYDVVKEEKINEIKISISELFDENEVSQPFVFLTGSYGTGKTTFTYRLIQRLLEAHPDLLAFEITNTNKLSDSLIIELIGNLEDAKKIIFYSNHSELDLNFKRIRELRGNVSSKQFENKSIVFLQSIRENALERFKKKMNPTIHEFNIDSPFSDRELNELVEKLNNNSITHYRSTFEKNRIISDLKVKLKLNDQLLISLYLMDNGNHSRHITETYNNFESDITKKAFLFTALLYRFGIEMPVNVLKEILGVDWGIFIEQVIKIDGKGIFIQEQHKPDFYLKPDLFFKIKHPIVADAFINKQVKDKNLYNYYRFLVTNLSEDETSVNTFINLIKSLTDNKVFDQSKIDSLYDLAYNKLYEFVRFNIYYSRNLQFRRTEKTLIKGLEILKGFDYNLGDKFRRNSQVTHRRACLNADLAKYYFHSDTVKSEEYFEEAFELFEIKLAIDPNSIFSYKDFIYLLMWYIKKWSLSEVELIRIQIKIANIVHKGIENLQEGINKLLQINETYINSILSDKIKVNERIDRLIDTTETRPYGLLLRVKVAERFPLNMPDTYSHENTLNELESFSYVEEVAIYLLHYYGENLNDYSLRVKYFDLLKNNEALYKKEELSILYYNFIAESYSFRFGDGFKHQRLIQKKYREAIKKEPLFWMEQNESVKREFVGKIKKNKWDYYEFRISNMGFNFRAKLNNRNINFEEFDLSEEYKSHLYFTYSGIWAELTE